MTINYMLHTTDDDDDCSIVGSQAAAVGPQQKNTPAALAALVWLDDTAGESMLPGGAVLSKFAPINRETEHEKKVRRIMANRKSAKESRDRRRNLLKTLSKQVDVLAAENKSMARTNAELQSQTQQLQQKLNQVLMFSRRQQQEQQQQQQYPLMHKDPLPDCRTKFDDEPSYLTSMVKMECLEPFDMQDTCSLWNTSDIWEPIKQQRDLVEI